MGCVNFGCRQDRPVIPGGQNGIIISIHDGHESLDAIDRDGAAAPRLDRIHDDVWSLLVSPNRPEIHLVGLGYASVVWNVEFRAVEGCLPCLGFWILGESRR